MHRLIESVGLPVRSFARPSEFLAAYDGSQPGCVVLDVRLPEMSGLELQGRLRSQRMRVPIIVITAYGDVASAVRAMEGGATDFIEKPINNQVLIDRVLQCIAADRQIHAVNSSFEDVRGRYSTLTRRERQVMALLVVGHPNKPIAEKFEIRPKTVEVHRANVVDKMKAESIVPLVDMARI